MGIVSDLLDRLRVLQADRAPWEQMWMETARYALPDAERFDTMFATGNTASALDSVVNEPVASKRSKEIYDQTSLWAVDRGANGTLSLATPQTGTWHNVASSDPFAKEATDEEKQFYDVLRDYLFATRANPVSGFWTAHKAAVRCMWGFGTAVKLSEGSRRGVSSPISYRYIPLSENHLATNDEDLVDSNYRLFTLSARQAAQKFNKDGRQNLSPKVAALAEDPKEKDKPVTFLHAVFPREERGSMGNTNRDMEWASFYVETSEKHLIGEGGYEEFPYTIFNWQRNNPGPYSEGPMALALADVKSLNMLAKNELRAVGQWVDPPYATMAGTERINLNPRAPNPGLLDENGNLKIKPIVTQQRPDFAQSILQARREQIKTTLYIDLWQSIINSQREQTAFEVMIKNQEKGDLLGPIGNSMQMGLALEFKREVGILVRLGAFDPGQALEPPDSVRGQDLGARFTSPLDKIRRLPQLQGMTQLTQLTGQISQFKPDVIDKIDWDEVVDIAADILDVPQKVVVLSDVLDEMRSQRANRANMQAAIEAGQAGGDAATAAAGGLEAVASSPVAQDVIGRLAGVAGSGGMGPAQAG